MRISTREALQEVFGCKAFAGKTPTWSEVANRLIYIAPLEDENSGSGGNPDLGGDPGGLAFPFQGKIVKYHWHL